MNPYEILGVANDASPEEIKKAYRKKSSEYHPDRNKDEDASQKQQEVNDAYRVLSNPKLKEQYDLSGDFENIINVDIEKDAINLIISFVNQLMSQPQVPEDYISVIKNILLDRKNMIDGGSNHINQDILRLERIAKKIRKKKGENLITKTIYKKINDLKQNVYMNSIGNRVLIRAMELMGDYEFLHSEFIQINVDPETFE